MQAQAIQTLLGGGDVMGFIVAALLFLRARLRTKDSLFSVFSVAFVFLALNQFLSGLNVFGADAQSWVFLPRLAAFTLLIVAIVGKNIAGRRRQ
jgi:hypothetical protein